MSTRTVTGDECPHQKGDWVRPTRGLWSGDPVCVHDVFRDFEGKWCLLVTDSPRPKAHSWPIYPKDVVPDE